MKNRLRIIRAERNLTQDQLANMCNISRATINAVENEIVIPNCDTLLKLCKTLKLKPQDIFFDFEVV